MLMHAHPFLCIVLHHPLVEASTVVLLNDFCSLARTVMHFADPLACDRAPEEGSSY